MNSRVENPRPSDKSVLRALATGPKTVAELMLITGWPEQQVYVVMSRMRREGFPITTRSKLGIAPIVKKRKTEFYTLLDSTPKTDSKRSSNNGGNNG